ncbi:DNA polymerase III subunit beta [Synechococcus sp. PCC 7336]|uniref:DNA polymerase III subunit beta n=1 Tax=Synechococcus sp. PCC 7336 TaxID=195250 RepID=UPI00034CB94F|nr:DNA polymerase III subunit beta [Synechococcus sp. PCC 7336]
MQLVCSQAELSQHIAFVSRAVSSRPNSPILANILLEADPAANTLALTAFDLSLGIRTQFEAQVLEGGRAALPARLLKDIVPRLPNADLTLSQPDLDAPATLSCLAGEYQIRGADPNEFPELPEIEGEIEELAVDDLLAGIGSTLFAAASDETKQVLTGVHVKSTAEGLEFAATDGHRLATIQVMGEADETEADENPVRGSDGLEFTIPARTLKELESVLSSQAIPTLKLQFDRSQVVVRLPDITITSRLLDGQYPNYAQLIPQQFERLATLDRRELISVLERIAVFAAEKNDILKFQFSMADQTVNIEAEAPDVGGGQESLPLQFSGEDLEIAFNVRYLLDALKVFNAAEVKLQMNGQTQPAVMEPLGAEKVKYLVMPVQIRP